MRCARELLLVTAVHLIVFAAAAQAAAPATFTPVAPTNVDRIRAEFSIPGGCGILPTTVITGTTIRTTIILTGCLIGPPPFTVPFTEGFGPLPAGTYTYEVYVGYQGEAIAMQSTQQLVVTASPIPMLAPAYEVLLIVGLLVSAGLVIHRTS